MFETKNPLTGLFGVCLICAAFLIFGCKGRPSAAVLPTNDLAAVTATPPAPAKTAPKIHFSSVYTKLDSKSCQPVRKPENDEDEVPYICSGYKDYKIYVNTHGIANFYVGREISATDREAWINLELPVFHFNAGFDQTVEWRLADGDPFACIVRAEYDKQIINPDEKGMANELVVKNLRGFAPIDIVIDARKTSRANEEAQSRADAGYKKL